MYIHKQIYKHEKMWNNVADSEVSPQYDSGFPATKRESG